MNREMLMLIDAISREKNVERDLVLGAVETALASATKKLYKGEVDIRVAIDPDSGAYETFRRWLVVPDEAGLQNPEAEELISDVADENPGIQVGDFIETEVIINMRSDGRGGRTFEGPRWLFREEKVPYWRSEFVVVSPRSRQLDIEVGGPVPAPVVS